MNKALDREAYLWVVEMWIDEPGMKKQWVPTVGVSLNREEARRELATWRESNVERFRLAKYARVK
jgi:hypothetical protein